MARFQSNRSDVVSQKACGQFFHQVDQFHFVNFLVCFCLFFSAETYGSNVPSPLGFRAIADREADSVCTVQWTEPSMLVDIRRPCSIGFSSPKNFICSKISKSFKLVPDFFFNFVEIATKDLAGSLAFSHQAAYTRMRGVDLCS
eukprot:s69_g33.t1